MNELTRKLEELEKLETKRELAMRLIEEDPADFERKETCPKHEAIFKYYRDELQGTEKASVSEHLKVCMGCSELYLIYAAEKTAESVGLSCDWVFKYEAAKPWWKEFLPLWYAIQEGGGSISGAFRKVAQLIRARSFAFQETAFALGNREPRAVPPKRSTNVYEVSVSFPAKGGTFWILSTGQDADPDLIKELKDLKARRQAFLVTLVFRRGFSSAEPLRGNGPQLLSRRSGAIQVEVPEDAEALLVGLSKEKTALEAVTNFVQAEADMGKVPGVERILWVLYVSKDFMNNINRGSR